LDEVKNLGGNQMKQNVLLLHSEWPRIGDFRPTRNNPRQEVFMALAASKSIIGGLWRWGSERFHRSGPAAVQPAGKYETTNDLSFAL